MDCLKGEGRGPGPGWRLLAVCLLCSMALPATACRGGGRSVAGSTAEPAQTIENKGSDTLVNLALAWAESYMGSHPEVRISVTGGGSGTGIAALINGTVDIANACSRSRTSTSAASATGAR
jgi:phosphate transport system substrate-binding protein